MPRPPKCRRVSILPETTYFKPAGIPLRYLEENCLTIEEVEAIRLRDLEHREQVDCAARMNVSRPTFQRVLAAARRKIADSLLKGKAICIKGGNYVLQKEYVDDNFDHEIEGGTMNNFKVAVVSEDGTTVSQHFGMAPWYMVYTIQDGKLAATEKREKAGHHQMGNAHPHGSQTHGHVQDTASQDLHNRMASTINDCKVLITGGMGMGAYQSMKSNNIEPIVTDVRDIGQAVKLYLQGKLPNLKERLH